MIEVGNGKRTFTTDGGRMLMCIFVLVLGLVLVVVKMESVFSFVDETRHDDGG